jgi:hypothetical protein
MNVRKLVVLLLAALALAVAGCGGDDSNEASGDTDTTVVEETTTEDTTEETTEETTTADTTTDDDTSLGGKCAEFAGLGAKISQAMSGGNAGLEEASALFDELASEVPDEIKADFEVIAENFAQIAEVLKDVDLAEGETPSAEDLAKLQELTTSINSTEVQQASQNIEAWAQENC